MSFDKEAIRKRIDEIQVEVKTAMEDPNLTPAEFKEKLDKCMAEDADLGLKLIASIASATPSRSNARKPLGPS